MRYLACLIVSILFSCQTNTCPEAPLSREQFAQISAELYFMEAHFQSVISDQIDSVLISNRNQIYEKFHTSDSIYQLSKKVLHKSLPCAYELQKMVEEIIKSKKPME